MDGLNVIYSTTTNRGKTMQESIIDYIKNSPNLKHLVICDDETETVRLTDKAKAIFKELNEEIEAEESNKGGL